MKTLGYLSAVMVVCLCALGCAMGTGGVYLQPSQKACAAGQGDDCWHLGELWLRKASWTFFTGWPHPVDQNQAREAYRRGCKLNSLRSCIALLERHLVDDQAAERAALVAYVASVGAEVRPDEQVKAADDALSEIAQADVAVKEKGDRERRANAFRQIAGALLQTTQEIASKLSAHASSGAVLHKKSKPTTAKMSKVQPIRAPVATPTQCVAYGQSCTGKKCCVSNSDAVCRNDRCCIPIGGSCSTRSDCCDAINARCSEPTNGGTTISRCCYPSGMAVSVPGECCSARLDPQTSLCQ